VFSLLPHTYHRDALHRYFAINREPLHRKKTRREKLLPFYRHAVNRCNAARPGLTEFDGTPDPQFA